MPGHRAAAVSPAVPPPSSASSTATPAAAPASSPSASPPSLGGGHAKRPDDLLGFLSEAGLLDGKAFSGVLLGYPPEARELISVQAADFFTASYSRACETLLDLEGLKWTLETLGSCFLLPVPKCGHAMVKVIELYTIWIRESWRRPPCIQRHFDFVIREIVIHLSFLFSSLAELRQSPSKVAMCMRGLHLLGLLSKRPILQVGSRVEVCGLVKMNTLNGQRGYVKGHTEGRILVHPDDTAATTATTPTTPTTPLAEPQVGDLSSVTPSPQDGVPSSSSAPPLQKPQPAIALKPENLLVREPGASVISGCSLSNPPDCLGASGVLPHPSLASPSSSSSSVVEGAGASSHAAPSFFSVSQEYAQQRMLQDKRRPSQIAAPDDSPALPPGCWDVLIRSLLGIADHLLSAEPSRGGAGNATPVEADATSSPVNRLSHMAVAVLLETLVTAPPRSKGLWGDVASTASRWEDSSIFARQWGALAEALTLGIHRSFFRRRPGFTASPGAGLDIPPAAFLDASGTGSHAVVFWHSGGRTGRGDRGDRSERERVDNAAAPTHQSRHAAAATPGPSTHGASAAAPPASGLGGGLPDTTLWKPISLIESLKEKDLFALWRWVLSLQLAKGEGGGAPPGGRVAEAARVGVARSLGLVTLYLSRCGWWDPTTGEGICVPNASPSAPSVFSLVERWAIKSLFATPEAGGVSRAEFLRKNAVVTQALCDVFLRPHPSSGDCVHEARLPGESFENLSPTVGASQPQCPGGDGNTHGADEADTSCTALPPAEVGGGGAAAAPHPPLPTGAAAHARNLRVFFACLTRLLRMASPAVSVQIEGGPPDPASTSATHHFPQTPEGSDDVISAEYALRLSVLQGMSSLFAHNLEGVSAFCNPFLRYLEEATGYGGPLDAGASAGWADVFLSTVPPAEEVRRQQRLHSPQNLSVHCHLKRNSSCPADSDEEDDEQGSKGCCQPPGLPLNASLQESYLLPARRSALCILGGLLGRLSAGGAPAGSSHHAAAFLLRVLSCERDPVTLASALHVAALFASLRRGEAEVCSLTEQACLLVESRHPACVYYSALEYLRVDTLGEGASSARCASEGCSPEPHPPQPGKAPGGDPHSPSPPGGSGVKTHRVRAVKSALSLLRSLLRVPAMRQTVDLGAYTASYGEAPSGCPCDAGNRAEGRRYSEFSHLKKHESERLAGAVLTFITECVCSADNGEEGGGIAPYRSALLLALDAAAASPSPTLQSGSLSLLRHLLSGSAPQHCSLITEECFPPEGSHARFFALDGNKLLTVVSHRGSSGAEGVTTVLRDSLGRQVWQAQLSGGGSALPPPPLPPLQPLPHPASAAAGSEEECDNASSRSGCSASEGAEGEGGGGDSRGAPFDAVLQRLASAVVPLPEMIARLKGEGEGKDEAEAYPEGVPPLNEVGAEGGGGGGAAVPASSLSRRPPGDLSRLLLASLQMLGVGGAQQQHLHHHPSATAPTPAPGGRGGGGAAQSSSAASATLSPASPALTLPGVQPAGGGGGDDVPFGAGVAAAAASVVAPPQLFTRSGSAGRGELLSGGAAAARDGGAGGGVGEGCCCKVGGSRGAPIDSTSSPSRLAELQDTHRLRSALRMVDATPPREVFRIMLVYLHPDAGASALSDLGLEWYAHRSEELRSRAPLRGLLPTVPEFVSFAGGLGSLMDANDHPERYHGGAAGEKFKRRRLHYYSDAQCEAAFPVMSATPSSLRSGAAPWESPSSSERWEDASPVRVIWNDTPAEFSPTSSPGCLSTQKLKACLPGFKAYTSRTLDFVITPLEGGVYSVRVVLPLANERWHGLLPESAFLPCDWHAPLLDGMVMPLRSLSRLVRAAAFNGGRAFRCKWQAALESVLLERRGKGTSLDLTARRRFTYASPELTRNALITKYCAILDPVQERARVEDRPTEGTRVSALRLMELQPGRRVHACDKGRVTRVQEHGGQPAFEVAFDNGVALPFLRLGSDIQAMGVPAWQPRALHQVISSLVTTS